MGIKDVDGAFTLPVQTVTIVPSTKAKSKGVSQKVFDARVRLVRKKMSSLFGGYTEVKGVGGFLFKGKDIRERVVHVTAYATGKSFSKNKSNWLSFVKSLKSKWGQESMGIIIENDLMFI